MAVRARGKILYINFRCYLPGGRRVRCDESTGLTDNKKNRKAVEAKDRAIKYHLRAGTFDYLTYFPDGSKAKFFKRPTSNILFSDWWNQWLDEKTIRPNTARGWNSTYRVHIGPQFGHRPISEISEHEILVFRKSLEGRLKGSSINDKIIKPLCMALYRAFKRGLIDAYPCEEIGRLDELPVDINPLSFKELTHLLDTLKKKNRPAEHDLIFIWSRTGLRPGELCALEWKHVDYYNNKLMIRQTMLPSGSVGPPKTKHSIRDVDIRPEVSDAFTRQEGRTGLMDSYIFTTARNSPYSDAYLRKRFRFWLRLAGLSYRPPKQMRHTFATLHLAAGENIGWVSRMLGHASPKITWDRYYRFIPNLTRDDGSAFETEIKKQKGSNQVATKNK